MLFGVHPIQVGGAETKPAARFGGNALTGASGAHAGACGDGIDDGLVRIGAGLPNYLSQLEAGTTLRFKCKVQLRCAQSLKQ